MATEPQIIDESEPTLTPEEIREHNFAQAVEASTVNHEVDLAHRSIGKTDEPAGVIVTDEPALVETTEPEEATEPAVSEEVTTPEAE